MPLSFLLSFVLLVLPVIGDAHALIHQSALALAPTSAYDSFSPPQQLQTTLVSTAVINVTVMIALLALSSIFIRTLIGRTLAGIAIFFGGMLIIAYMTPIYFSFAFATEVECSPATACAIITLNESELQFNDKFRTVLDPVSFKHSAYINYFDELSIRMFVADHLASNNNDPTLHSIDRQNVILHYRDYYYLPVISHAGEDIILKDVAVPIPYLVMVDVFLVGLYSIMMIWRRDYALHEEKLPKTKQYFGNVSEKIRQIASRRIRRSLASEINSA